MSLYWGSSRQSSPLLNMVLVWISHSSIHGLLTFLGCLLVAELAYFVMQDGQHIWKDALSLAVEEYKTSNMQAAISKAVKAVFYEHNGDMDGLCKAIIEIIMKNRMSNKLLME
ncbi:hypothetical protein BKA82DRAFT_2195135 [Pisolithus tinctorius]|nr:hypothetical protein BKA82DRAFT_2195135 [Pisolithus tinctorius]